MSIDTAVSRISQILSMEQQLVSPAASTTPAPASTDGPSFSQQLQSAQAAQAPSSAAALVPGQASQSLGAGALNSSGYALPLDRQYLKQLGRTDDGLDIETAPDGANVYSMTPGIVTAVAADPSGFGPNYPVIKVTAGPLAGKYIYYGHVASSLVHVGQVVQAGQPIAVMGHTGDAQSLGHGHIEIGFSDAGGDPIDHHGDGADASTPSGDQMRQFIVALSASFGIQNS